MDHHDAYRDTQVDMSNMRENLLVRYVPLDIPSFLDINFCNLSFHQYWRLDL